MTPSKHLKISRKCSTRSTSDCTLYAFSNVFNCFLKLSLPAKNEEVNRQGKKKEGKGVPRPHAGLVLQHSSTNYHHWSATAADWLTCISSSARSRLRRSGCCSSVFLISSCRQRQRPIHSSTTVSCHPLLRTGGYCSSSLVLSACRCGWKPVQLDYGEDPIISSVTVHTTSP